MDFETTEEIKVPESLIDQVIGQETAVEVIKKAAKQKRHILLIGEPGTGKSMLGQGMAELLPVEELQDILVHPNPEDKNTPRIEVVKAGEGEEIIRRFKEQKKKAEMPINFVFRLTFLLILFLTLTYAFVLRQPLILFGGIIATTFLLMMRQYVKVKEEVMVPKLLVNNSKRVKAPFVDATGSHAGALLGDVRHDPFQSGGLETPSHDLVEAGAIHKAHKGVLFIDEIKTLDIHSQQSLLTALQEKKYPITGQSERSSGAMVRTEPVPCDFVLIAAGNLEAIKGMHPALRSRIRGYGYEVYMKDVMDDTPENRNRLVRFVAQEVKKDGKIPHFRRDAVIEIIMQAKKLAGRRGKLTLKLRGLGGLVRAAGDVAVNEGAELVTKRHVQLAKELSKSLEQQVADRYISVKKEYDVYKRSGAEVGRVNGLAVIGDSGVILPIVAEVAPAQSREEGKIIATGKLRTIAKEAIQNVSALIKKHTGRDISSYDIHIQFLQTYEGVEGDSASISVATAVISALENIPIDQSVAMTGSLSVRGDVLPVGGITAKIEAAISAGIKKVIIPSGNMKDILLDRKAKAKVEIIPVKTLSQVLENALTAGESTEGLLERIKTFIPVPKEVPKGAAKKHVL
ncbi:MAG: ATP-dependent protease LonB [Methanobacteriota archaeon]|nr:MAG: ATP-dependent protease LonB [Euryarchaeota archaeon]